MCGIKILPIGENILHYAKVNTLMPVRAICIFFRRAQIPVQYQILTGSVGTRSARRVAVNIMMPANITYVI